MGTTKKEIGKYLVIRLRGCKKKVMFIMVVMVCCFGAVAQNATQTITITESKFANPLIEKWTSEYSKVNPGINFKFIKSSNQNEQSDLKLTVNNSAKNEDKLSENQVTVGRLAILPVANVKNKLFDKQLRNGIKQDEFKNIFLGIEPDQFDSDQKTSSQPSFTLYSQTPQSATAKVLVDHFGQSISELGGIIVTGDEKYLIESVLSDSTGVTYGNLSLIYDLNNREPLKGLKILPIDPDNNGRLKKEELVYSNLDQLISFLESSKVKTIPSEDISFTFNKKNNHSLAEDFVNWVRISGQTFNHQYGFLRTSVDKEPALTQK